MDEQIKELQESLYDSLKISNSYIHNAGVIENYNRLFEKNKQVALERIKDILGSLCYISDLDVSLYVESQLETMMKCIALNENYTNLKKAYMSFELPCVYFQLKEVYKDFKKSCWWFTFLQIVGG